MKTTRNILFCAVLAVMASAALAVVPNYLYIDQQTEKWYKSEGAGKIATMRIHTLVAYDFMDQGKRSVTWNGKDDRGSPVASGTYIYRLQAGESESTNRMTLIR